MFTDLDISLNKIKKKNEKEYQKKLKKFNLKDNRVIDNSDSYLIKKYVKDREQTNYINSIRLKTLRLENTDKYFKGTEEEFFKKYNQKENKIFKKKWITLPYNLKIIKINEYFNNNKLEDNVKKTILNLLENKQLKKQVEYDMEKGIITEIKL